MNSTLSMRQIGLVALVAVVVFAAGGFLVVSRHNSTTQTTASSTPAATTPAPSKTHTHSVTPAKLSTPTDKSSAVIPWAAARITVSCRKAARRRGAGRAGGAEATNTPFPRRASTYPLRFRSSMTRATVFGLTLRKPASSRMLGRAWSGGTPPVSMT